MPSTYQRLWAKKVHDRVPFSGPLLRKEFIRSSPRDRQIRRRPWGWRFGVRRTRAEIRRILEIGPVVTA